MARSDDLIPVLGRQSGQAVRFRQGTVLSWNSDTGQNSIDVGGAVLVDVPVLNTGDAVALQAGHVVGLLTFGPAWFILGRILVPGAVEFAPAAVAFGGVTGHASNFPITTTLTTRVSASIPVPAWVDEAAVMLMFTGAMYNPVAGAADTGLAQAFVNGVSGAGVPAELPANTNSPFAAACQRVVVNPGASILVEGKLMSTFANWGAIGINVANVNALAIFRSTS